MAQRVFVNVVGFSDEERHALNLLFRISGEQGTPFVLWEPNAPEPAKLAIIDGQSYEAPVELELRRNADIPIIWIGNEPHPRARQHFSRPIAWPEVVQAMDELFPAPPDLDLDFDSVDTQPPDPLPANAPPPKRVLIASADRNERLYMRAKLSLVNLTQADDAESAAEALELARMNDYELAIVDFELPGSKGWDFMRDLKGGQRPIAKTIVIAERGGIMERIRARLDGMHGFLVKPPNPARLHLLLRDVKRWGKREVKPGI
jgi:CheY-like chemotaxis protein